MEGEKTCGIGLVEGTVRVRWRAGGGLGTSGSGRGERGVKPRDLKQATVSAPQLEVRVRQAAGCSQDDSAWLLGVWRCRTGGQQGSARVVGKNGSPVSPLGKEFESAVESGDKPGVWTRGRNVGLGPVEAGCLLHS